MKLIMLHMYDIKLIRKPRLSDNQSHRFFPLTNSIESK
jgi:hypothetical protein